MSIQRLELKGAEDTPLLEALAALPEAWVLVTQDRTMPLEHADAMARNRPTLAIVVLPQDLLGEEVDWAGRDIVHRWAHVMQAQEATSIREYTQTRSLPWYWRQRGRARRSLASRAV